MFNNGSKLSARAAVLALSMIFVSACEGQTPASKLDYRQIIACNVTVERHFDAISFPAFKRHDGTWEGIEREEMNQRRAWLSLAIARGKSPDEIQGDLKTERLRRTADDGEAELERLNDLYLKSEPSLRLMPYYKPLSAKEREDVMRRFRGIMEASRQKNEILYRQCLAAFP